jgi:sensor domain CHASE-containing protein
MRERYLGAPEVEEMMATAEQNAALWAAVWRRSKVPDGRWRRSYAIARCAAGTPATPAGRRSTRWSRR